MKGMALLWLIGMMAGASMVLTAERGTPAEAKAMLEKSVTHYKAAGRKQALVDFNAKKSPCYDRDLDVVCFDSKRIILANGGVPSVRGLLDRHD